MSGLTNLLIACHLCPVDEEASKLKEQAMLNLGQGGARIGFLGDRSRRTQETETEGSCQVMLANMGRESIIGTVRAPVGDVISERAA